MKFVRTVFVAALGMGALIAAAPAAEARTPARRLCVQAIAEAREVGGITARFSQAVADHLHRNGETADEAVARGGSISAVTDFVRAITSSTQTLSSDTDALTEELSPHVASFNAAAAKCK